MWNYHSKSNTQLGKAGKTPWPTVRTTEDIPSVTSFRQGEATESMQYRQEKIDISAGYTVAPAYNKGAYQVISKENIKYIGK